MLLLLRYTNLTLTVLCALVRASLIQTTNGLIHLNLHWVNQIRPFSQYIFYLLSYFFIESTWKNFTRLNKMKKYILDFYFPIPNSSFNLYNLNKFITFFNVTHITHFFKHINDNRLRSEWNRGNRYFAMLVMSNLTTILWILTKHSGKILISGRKMR